MMEKNDQPTDSLPDQVNFWLTESSEHDCYFIVGPESGPKERIGVVKTFLKGYSEVFRVMLGSGPLGTKDDISLTDTNPATFKTFLKCAYGLSDSTINALPVGEALDFLTCVDKYLINEFKTKVLDRLARIDTFEEYCIVIQYLNPTILLSYNSLKKCLEILTKQNATIILQSDVILQIQSDFFRFIVQTLDNALETSKASFVWGIILKRTKHESQTKVVEILRETLEKYIDLVNFDKMTSEELCTKVFITGILSEDKILSICNNRLTQFTYKAVTGKKDMYEISILHNVNNISSFSGSQYSNSLELKDFSWSVTVQKLKEPNLGVYISCHSINSSWKCNIILLKISLLNQQGKPDLYFNTSQLNFNKEQFSRGWKNLCPWEKLVDISQGFISDDQIKLKVEFTVDYNV